MSTNFRKVTNPDGHYWVSHHPKTRR
jgi:hypothetical protein